MKPKTQKLAIANFFFWKKNIKVWAGIAMMIIYFNITIQCIRTDNGSAHLPSAGNCPKEKACVEEVSAFLWPLLHFLWCMDVTPGRPAPLPLTAREQFAISFSVSKTYPRKTTRHPPELRTSSCCLFWWVLYFIVNVKFFKKKRNRQLRVEKVLFRYQVTICQYKNTITLAYKQDVHPRIHVITIYFQKERIFICFLTLIIIKP